MYQMLNNQIRIEDVAAKLAAIDSDSDPCLLDQMAAKPRLRELLLFLWRMSLLPGGLKKFLEEFLAMYRDRNGTPAMVKAKSDKYTLAEKLAIFCEIPARDRPRIQLGRDNVMGEILAHVTTGEIADLDATDRKALESALDEVDSETFRNICCQTALKHLPLHFVALCTRKGESFEPSWYEDVDNERDLLEDERAHLNRPHVAWEDDIGTPAIQHWRRHSRISSEWYFQDVIGALVEFMDRWTVKVQGRLAITAVTRRVFETVDEVLGTGEPCFLRGDSRFGKTESLKLKAEMHPGRLVFVPVPRGNSLRDLLNNIAESLCIDRSYGSDLWTLGSRIRYIFRWTGLVPLFDEGAWLIPASYSKTTQPDRLNWLRSELFERGVPAVIAVTPQWYDESKPGRPSPLAKFIAKTNYAMEQFTGRCRSVELPRMLDEADLVRVAAFHFPEFKRKADLLEVAAVALTADGYLKAIEQLSKHARYIAKRDGVPLTMDLTRRAVRECYPNQQMPRQGTGTPGIEDAQRGSPEAGTRRTRPTAGRGVNEPCKTTARGIQPAGMSADRKEVFDSCSLLGAGAERAKTDRVPVEV